MHYQVLQIGQTWKGEFTTGQVFVAKTSSFGSRTQITKNLEFSHQIGQQIVTADNPAEEAQTLREF